MPTVKLHKDDRALLNKLDCDEDFYGLVKKQIRHALGDAQASTAVSHGYLLFRIRALLASIRAYEETQ